MATARLIDFALESDLDHTAKAVLVVLCDHAGAKMVCWPSVERLMQRTSLSDRCVQQSLCRLEAEGYIRRWLRPSRASRYGITNPLAWPKRPWRKRQHGNDAERGERGPEVLVVDPDDDAVAAAWLDRPEMADWRARGEGEPGAGEGERGSGGGEHHSPLTTREQQQEQNTGERESAQARASTSGPKTEDSLGGKPPADAAVSPPPPAPPPPPPAPPAPPPPAPPAPPPPPAAEPSARAAARAAVAAARRSAEPLTPEDLVVEGVDADVAVAWAVVRAKKRAVLTRLAWESVKRQIARAGMTLNEGVTVAVQRSWAGFNADWLEPAGGGGGRGLAVAQPRLSRECPPEFADWDDLPAGPPAPLGLSWRGGRDA